MQLSIIMFYWLAYLKTGRHGWQQWPFHQRLTPSNLHLQMLWLLFFKRKHSQLHQHALLVGSKADRRTLLQLAEVLIQSTLRGGEDRIPMVNITGDQTIPQWHRFLTNTQNKTCLSEFLVQVWKSPNFCKKFFSKEIIVPCGTLCYQLRRDSAAGVDKSTSN